MLELESNPYPLTFVSESETLVVKEKDHVCSLLIDWECIYFNTRESTPSFLSDAKRRRTQSLSLNSSRSSSPSSTDAVRSYCLTSTDTVPSSNKEASDAARFLSRSKS